MKDVTMTDAPKVPRDSSGALRPDLLVIGAGSGGLSAAAGAVRLGASVVLVEGAEMGGDCLNTGCVPSKALLAAGKAAYAMGAGARFGVTPVAAQIDFAAAKAHVNAVIADIAPHDSQDRFEGMGVEVIRAWAHFTGPGSVEAGGLTIKPRRVVIATGSTAAVPPIPGLADLPFLTNETIFALTEAPAHLLILGAGPIGMELAQAHRRLGCGVTVLEAGAPLGHEDPEMAAVALAALRAEGIEIIGDTPAAKAGGTAGALWLEAADGRRWTGSHLLVAAGRRPSLDRLNLTAAGVEVTRTGVKVDAGLRSTNRRVYAIGDAAGGLQFTHVAGWHAGLVIRAVLFRLPIKAIAAIPRVTYTDPEIAQVGLTETEAREKHGSALEVLRSEYAGNDRAKAESKTAGFLKVMVVKGRPVGASMVGAQAGELIQIWQLAMSARLKIGAIAGMIAPYPTLSELSKRAAGSYYEPRLFANPWVKRAVRLLAKLG
ncbi:MAG: pyruvate/2-oxoglutarate dehydrogenase complex dihydrolipoamide dehydrogenase (E3) component [Paracoccaceae bacterium]|jgi:pyruvate/2-oxoglutarate dehydrogenase complex dihydrolipoamide dehydrogenase (E3) component